MSTMLRHKTTFLAFCLFFTAPNLTALPAWVRGVGNYFIEMMRESGKTVLQGTEFIGKEIAVTMSQESAKNALRERLETTPINLAGYQTTLEIDNELYDDLLLHILKVYIVRHYNTLDLKPDAILIKIKGVCNSNTIINMVKNDLKEHGHNPNDFVRRFSAYMNRYYTKFSQEAFQDEWNKKKTLLIWTANQGVGVLSRYIIELLRNVIASLGTHGFTLSLSDLYADAQRRTAFIDPVTRKFSSSTLWTIQSLVKDVFMLSEDFATSKSKKLSIGVVGCLAQLYFAAAQFVPTDIEFLTDALILYRIWEVICKAQELHNELLGKNKEAEHDDANQNTTLSKVEKGITNRRPLNTYPAAL